MDTQQLIIDSLPLAATIARRISGAVLDGLRREDRLSRSARAQTKAGPKSPVQPIQLTGPDQVVGVLVSPHDHAADAERQRLVADAIETLPVRLRAVLLAYYYDEKVMAEVGSEIGVGNKRTSELHCDALNLLRQYFRMRGFRRFAEVRH